MNIKKHHPFTSLILVAGGRGSRMNMELPKQFISLNGKKLIDYSLEQFLAVDEIDEIIIVCDQAYRHLIHSKRPHQFAPPGLRRQDSVFNGLSMVSPQCEFVCVHDSARPFVDEGIIRQALHAAYVHNASVVGMPIKYTVKEIDAQEFVRHTPDRSTIWEIQTPQVARHDLLIRGFSLANQQNLTVTDDVSLVELIGHPVKIVRGSYRNLKVTTLEDLQTAQALMS